MKLGHTLRMLRVEALDTLLVLNTHSASPQVAFSTNARYVAYTEIQGRSSLLRVRT
jgi:hypothetical protein